MLTKNDVKKTYNVDVAISSPMQAAIAEWYRMYVGKADWMDEETGIHSLRLEQAITREFANTSLNEMSLNISNTQLNKIFEKATRDLNINLQKGLATGALVIKPLGGDKVQYVPQDAFIPIEYDVNGRLIKVIFPESKQIAENEWLTRLEYHSLDYTQGLTITNRAFRSNSQNTLGREIPLASVPEWANLSPYVLYKIFRPAFGYYVNPIDNTIDGSHAGVSIFEPAKRIIKKADIQFGRLDWEFESGERAINVDEMALRQDENGNTKTDKLRKRLYRGLNIEGGSNGDFFKEFSPQLRQADFIAGLDEYKRGIEFAVGLSYGDISNPQSVDKTATEIKSAKQRKYDTVTAIQKNLETCLDDLCYALAFYNSMTESGYEFTVNFEDSILTDDDTKRTQDRQDVSMGVMQLWEYRMRWYGEDEETAKKNVPQQADVITDGENVITDSDDGTTAEVQGKSLNGAQTQSLIAIMAQLSAHAISEGQAVRLIATAIGISMEEARAIINGDLE